MTVKVRLSLSETKGISHQNVPITQGVPLPKGALHNLESVWVEDGNGQPVSAQFRTLGRWDDGRLKWVLTDFSADVPAEGGINYFFCYGQKPASIPSHGGIQIKESDDRITVCTGSLRFVVNRQQFSLIESVELGNVDAEGGFLPECEVVNENVTSRGEAWVRICESFNDAQGKRYIYGMGGDCLASLAKDDYTVELEEVGPLRVVIKCSGSYEADIPFHHYAGYRPFRMVTRIYAYAGQTYLRVLHTVVVACNPRETEVEEIAIRVPVSLKNGVHFRAAPLYPPAGGGIKGGATDRGKSQSGRSDSVGATVR